MEVIVKNCAGKYDKESDIWNTIKYVIKEEKNYFYGGLNIRTNNIDDMVEQFSKVKNVYGKEEGRQVFHIIVSFKNYKEDIKKFKTLTKKIVSFWKETSQVIYGVHNDTDNIHIHLIVNSVCFNTGKKLRYDFETKNRFENYVNSIY